MAGSVNKMFLIGNLGDDPKITTLASGDKMARFDMATTESWKDKTTGERKKNTEWHRVVIFNKHLAELVEKYTRKGSKVCVEGQHKTRSYERDGGAKIYQSECVLQGFNANITLLDGQRTTSVAIPDDSGSDDYGPDDNGTGDSPEMSIADERMAEVENADA